MKAKDEKGGNNLHELLEKLNKPFDDKFKKKVSLTEITRFSLNLHKNSAIVITNSHIYLINKKMFFININKLPLKNLEEILFRDKKIELIILGENFKLPVEASKSDTVMKFVNKVKALKDD